MIWSNTTHFEFTADDRVKLLKNKEVTASVQRYIMRHDGAFIQGFVYKVACTFKVLSYKLIIRTMQVDCESLFKRLNKRKGRKSAKVIEAHIVAFPAFKLPPIELAVGQLVTHGLLIAGHAPYTDQVTDGKITTLEKKAREFHWRLPETEAFLDFQDLPVLDGGKTCLCKHFLFTACLARAEGPMLPSQINAEVTRLHVSGYHVRTFNENVSPC